jgi:hypothetical protein
MTTGARSGKRNVEAMGRRLRSPPPGATSGRDSILRDGVEVAPGDRVGEAFAFHFCPALPFSARTPERLNAQTLSVVGGRSSVVGCRWTASRQESPASPIQLSFEENERDRDPIRYPGGMERA